MRLRSHSQGKDFTDCADAGPTSLPKKKYSYNAESNRGHFSPALKKKRHVSSMAIFSPSFSLSSGEGKTTDLYGHRFKKDSLFTLTSFTVA